MTFCHVGWFPLKFSPVLWSCVETEATIQLDSPMKKMKKMENVMSDDDTIK